MWGGGLRKIKTCDGGVAQKNMWGGGGSAKKINYVAVAEEITISEGG